MSIAPIRGPVQRPGGERDMTEIFQRLDDLDRRPPGRWVYAGTYPGDANTTPDSPPFQNGITGFLRFRRTNEWDLQVEADIVGMSPGDVVTNIAAFYTPPREAHGVGTQGDDTLSVWKVATNGDIVYVGPVSGGGPGSDTTAIHWGANTDPDGSGVTLTGLGGGYVFIQDSVLYLYDDNGDLRAKIGYDGAYLFQLMNAGLPVVDIDESPNHAFYNEDGDAALFISGDGEIRARLKTGKPFTLNDSFGNPMLQMTEGSPDLHIPAGGNVVADL